MASSLNWRNCLILYVYKNSLCDPVRDIGMCRKFGSAKDVDDYLDLFIASVQPRYINNYRAFITNDDVEFEEVDSYVLMNEPLRAQLTQRIKEDNLWQRALHCNTALQAAVERREQAIKRAAAAKMENG
jgi:hypothetical protein